MAYVKKTNNPNYGRPKTHRSERFELRLSKTEAQLLEECSAITGLRRTDVVVKALAMLHKTLREGNKQG